VYFFFPSAWGDTDEVANLRKKITYGKYQPLCPFPLLLQDEMEMNGAATDEKIGHHKGGGGGSLCVRSTLPREAAKQKDNTNACECTGAS